MGSSHDRPAAVPDLGFEPDALRQRYAEERDKRLRPDATDQYREMAGELAHFADDPYVERPAYRPALEDDVDAVVIGGGFGGLLSAANLRKAGLDRIRVVDKAGDFGGTWYWNRYPGVQCDIESYIYLPLLEEMNYVPKEKYSYGPEILSYSKQIAERYELYHDALFHTGVTGIAWDHSRLRWLVRTGWNDRVSARFVITSSGPLNKPKMPGIPGVASFRGHAFHTSRWDYSFTGGSSEGGLSRLADKRVAIIGTGATAVQCIPHLGAAARHLYVFQRTPSAVDERRNRPTDPAWASSLTRGWQRSRMENFTSLVSGVAQDEDLVGDGWTDIARMAVFLLGDGGDAIDQERAAELADFAKMEQVRRRVGSMVADPRTADALKPYYRMFCKRPCFHDDYLETFNLPNVTLVDTDGKGVDRISESGVVVGDREYPVDCLIFATGFEASTPYTRRTGFDVIGRDGIRLSDKWAEGLKTYHGLHSAGFPNMFHLGVTQTGITNNVCHMLTEQAEHIRYLVGRCLTDQIGAIEATQDAEDRWVETIRSLGGRHQGYLRDCTPGFLNSEGRTSNPHGPITGQYGLGAPAFFELLREWREKDTLEGLVRYASR